MFTTLYDNVITWSRHRHAPKYLAGMSFAESSFFPIPPDVMPIPMVLSKPAKGWYLATITTIASLLGGIFGYLLGMFAFEIIEPMLQSLHYMDKIDKTVKWFNEWGFWIIFIAGFSPIPYKLFTITAGMLSMALIPFIIASFIGRGARFFLVASLIIWGGEKMEQQIRTHVERIGWFMVALIAIGVAIYALR